MAKLTGPQITRLIIVMRQAFDKLDNVGAIEHDALHSSQASRFDHWRKAELLEVTNGKRESLREVQNNEFLFVEAHFLTMIGKDGKAVDNIVRASAPDHTTVEQFRELIAQAQAEWGFNDGYLASILRHRFKGKLLTSLNAGDLRHLLSTLNNRGRSKRDGASHTRNKKQSLTKRQPPTLS